MIIGSIGASLFILKIIKFGYKLPPVNTPPKAAFDNNNIALLNYQFVTSGFPICSLTV